MTIEQMVEIPANHQIILEIPSEIPVGATARLELIWSPRKEFANNLDDTLERIWKLCKGSSLTVESFLEMRNQDKELEEGQYQRFFSQSGDGN